MRNTICAALTTITLALCTALAGCGGMAKASTPAHAVKPIDSQCTDVLPGLGGKGEYEVGSNTCYEPSSPPTIVYILEKEAE